MAWSLPSAASASLPSAKSSVPRWKYDVFLSFRGEDTRKGIISHLNHELQKTGGIKTFKDDERLPVGAPISPNLLRAIQESRFAIVVLSSNYASSSWCLDELVKIFQYMEDKDRILPLFYQVDPSDVRHQRGSFEVAFTKHEKSGQGIEKLKQWKVALGKVANLSGWDTNNFHSELELVKEIVKFLCSKVLPVSVGSYGSNGGKCFDDGVYSTVRQLVICYADYGIDYIQIEYDSDGISLWSDEHGSPGTKQSKTVQVMLDYPDEFFTSIHGCYEKFWRMPTQITSLTFQSNKKTYGPFGDEDGGGTVFSIQVPGSKIVGFYGRSSDYFFCLRAIGAHLRPLDY